MNNQALIPTDTVGREVDIVLETCSGRPEERIRTPPELPLTQTSLLPDVVVTQEAVVFPDVRASGRRTAAPISLLPLFLVTNSSIN